MDSRLRGNDKIFMESFKYTDEMREKIKEEKKVKQLQQEAGSSVWVRRHHREKKPAAQQLYVADKPAEDKPRMEKYPKVATDDYEKVKEEWQELDKMIENSESNAIVFIGSVTDEERTGTSARIYNDLFKEKYEQDENVIIVGENDVRAVIEMAKNTKRPVRAALHKLGGIIAAHPDKKVVFSFPYLLKELSLRPDFYEIETGAPTEFHNAIREKIGDDPDLGALCWFDEQGIISLGDKEIEGPSPEEVAKRQVKGIENFMRLTRILSPSRQAIRISFGHGWNLDALAIYLAKGEAGKEGFEEVLDGQIFANAKGFDISVEKSGIIKMHCKGKEFVIPKERL